ncbi:hypothetical protein P7C73_g2819, partial [Tremellales sp. Uapishka_1]
MVSEKGTRIAHGLMFGLLIIVSIVCLAVSGSLVHYYNDHGYPRFHDTAYKQRIRILLVASVWTTVFARASLFCILPHMHTHPSVYPPVVLTVGFHTIGSHIAFGLLAHLVPIVIGFILFLIGVASLTALTDKVDCGINAGNFARCDVVKGLVVVSWIETIFLLITLVFLIILALKARGGYGVHKSTLYNV